MAEVKLLLGQMNSYSMVDWMWWSIKPPYNKKGVT